MIDRLLAWFRKPKPPPPPTEEDLTPELKGEVRQAIQKHASSSRLLRLRALRTERIGKTLNELLALQATAKEGIRAADLALKELDRAKHAQDDHS